MNNSNHTDVATTFIVEVDAPSREAASRAERALASGRGVRYLRSVLVPLDGKCLHFVDAPSAAAIGQAAAAAAIRFERIVKVVDAGTGLPALNWDGLKAA
jgi:hypothetical protein